MIAFRPVEDVDMMGGNGSDDSFTTPRAIFKLSLNACIFTGSLRTVKELTVRKGDESTYIDFDPSYSQRSRVLLDLVSGTWLRFRLVNVCSCEKNGRYCEKPTHSGRMGSCLKRKPHEKGNKQSLLGDCL
jgi:hypothetical protein